MGASIHPGNTRKRTLAILAGLVLGIIVGLTVHSCYPAYIGAAGQLSSLLTGLFLRLIRMVIAPLVFATLVCGIAKMGDQSLVIWVGGQATLWSIGTSFLSLCIGLLGANLLSPGVGASPPQAAHVSPLKHPLQSL